MFRRFSGSIKKTVSCSTAILLLFLLISPISIAQDDANGAVPIKDDEQTAVEEVQTSAVQPATDGAVSIKEDEQATAEEALTSEVQTEASEKKMVLPNLPWWAAVLIILAVIAAGWWMVHIGYKADDSLSSGEIRRAIAAVLVLGFVIITVLSMLYEIPNKEIVTSYTQLVGVIIGFYFGSKIASEKDESEDGDANEKVDEINKTITNIVASAKTAEEFTNSLNGLLDNIKKLGGKN